MTQSLKRVKTILTWAGAAAILTWMATAGATSARGLQKSNAETLGTHQAAPAGQPDIDSERGALDRFLDAHPDVEADVFSDPHRMVDPNYLQQHPELEAFLESHPLVKADPRSFVSPQSWRFGNQQNSTDMLLGWLIPFAVFVCCLLALLVVMRTVLENRRWNKSFKVHEDVHTKLIEKFASGEELRGYMESDAGRRLLEWTPPAIEARAPVAVTRILWSLTAGLILGPAGIGFLWIRNLVPDAGEGLLIIGTLFLTVGIGFFCSALLSYGIAKHLGLISPAAQGNSRLAPAGR